MALVLPTWFNTSTAARRTYSDSSCRMSSRWCTEAGIVDLDDGLDRFRLDGEVRIAQSAADRGNVHRDLHPGEALQGGQPHRLVRVLEQRRQGIPRRIGAEPAERPGEVEARQPILAAGASRSAPGSWRRSQPLRPAGGSACGAPCPPHRATGTAPGGSAPACAARGSRPGGPWEHPDPGRDPAADWGRSCPRRRGAPGRGRRSGCRRETRPPRRAAAWNCPAACAGARRSCRRRRDPRAPSISRGTARTANCRSVASACRLLRLRGILGGHERLGLPG